MRQVLSLMGENLRLQFATIEAVEAVGGEYEGSVALNLSCAITGYWMASCEG